MKRRVPRSIRYVFKILCLRILLNYNLQIIGKNEATYRRQHSLSVRVK